MAENGDDQDPELGYVAFRRPLWALGFEDARWLLPTKSDDAPLVVFTNLAETTKQLEKQPEIHPTTVMGAWSRAIPFYLAESVWHRTPATGTVLLAVAKGVGPTISYQPYEAEDVQQLFEKYEDEKAPSLIVTGEEAIDVGGFRTKVELTIWQFQDRRAQRCGRAVVTSWTKGPGEIARELEAKFVQALEGCHVPEAPEATSNYVAPDENVTPYYIYALEHLLLQSLVAADYSPVNEQNDDDSKFQAYLWLCEQMPDAIVPRLMFLRGLVASEGYGSTVHDSFEPIGLDWLEQPGDAQEPIRRLSPLIFKKLGRNEDFDRRRKELLQTATGDYRAWLEKLQNKID